MPYARRCVSFVTNFILCGAEVTAIQTSPKLIVEKVSLFGRQENIL